MSAPFLLPAALRMLEWLLLQHQRPTTYLGKFARAMQYQSAGLLTCQSIINFYTAAVLASVSMEFRRANCEFGLSDSRNQLI